MKKDKPLITVRNVTAGYGSTVILENISFDVFEGEVFIILGGSGCGKTTLLKHLIGLYQFRCGQAFIDGIDIAKAEGEQLMTFYQKIGVLYQNGALFGSMTLLENVMLLLEEFTSLPLDARETIASLKLKLVKLDGFEHYMPAELSGGMQKRAAIARAMVLDPKIIFLDEPSAGLDPITAAELDQLILQLAENLKLTFVVVTHALDSIFTIAQRVVFLDKESKGIIAEGEPHYLKEHCDNDFVRRFFNREVTLK